MPIPNRKENEERQQFISRCMSDKNMKKDFPGSQQRVAVCLSKALDGMSSVEAADMTYQVETFGYTEALNEDNFIIPQDNDYVDFEEETIEWDVAAERPGLWENIRRKKEREGKNYKPAKPGDPDRPTPDQIKRAQSHIEESYADHLDESEALQYGKPSKNDPRKTPAPPKDRKRGSKKNKPDSAKNPSGKITFSKETTAKLAKLVRGHNAKGKGSKASLGMLKAVYRRGAGAFSTSHHPKMSRDGWAMARVRAFLYLLRNGRPSNPNYKQDNDLLPKSHPKKSKGAEYQGRKVTLNKPFRTPDGPKKFAVYTKNGSGNVVIVRFGDPNMEIKKDNPKRRKSFRARHKCDTAPGPKWKARYWSCKMW